MSASLTSRLSPATCRESSPLSSSSLAKAIEQARLRLEEGSVRSEADVRNIVVRNPTDLDVAVIGRLYKLRQDESFYRQLREKIRGRKRAQIAESPEGTGAPKHVRPLPGGWHLNTNLSTRDKLRNLERACEVAGIAFGSDLVVEIDGERVAGRGT